MQLYVDVSPPAKYHELKADFEPSALCPWSMTLTKETLDYDYNTLKTVQWG